MKLETKISDNHTSVFLRFKIPFFSKTFRLHSLVYNTPDAWVHGYSSRTEQGRYVLFHDYDSLDLTSVMDDLKYLQKKYNLSEYYIFKTDREDSFHAVCLDTFSLSDAYDIQKDSSCDLAFIHSIKRLKTKEWILRIGEKGNRDPPKFFCSLKGTNPQKNVKSSAHANFMIKHFDMKEFIHKTGKWDKCSRLALVDYDTANRVVK